MKYLVTFIITLSIATNVYALEQTKKVCINKVSKDGKRVIDKDGKQIKECREMKNHQKLNGTKVPERK